jgi:hypothetical protein
MPNKPRKPIAALIGELQSWLPNYNHGPKDYPTLLWRILASLPGGDQAEDMGYEPFSLGWQEIDQLGRMLTAIENQRDVEDLIQGLLGEEEEEVEEARRRGPPYGGETVVRGPYEAMRLPSGKWRLSLHGTVLGTFPTEKAAMDAATDHERGGTHVREAPPRQPVGLSSSAHKAPPRVQQSRRHPARRR